MGISAPWKVITASVRGTTHVRRQIPNQDAVAFEVVNNDAPMALIAVSDGHGSERCFRSDVGSRLAVEVALKVCRAGLEGLAGASPSEVKDTVQRRVPGQLVRAWQQCVLQHGDNQPFTDDEIAMAPASLSLAVENGLSQEQTLQAYGATLLVAMITEKFAVYLQLGDGEVLVVSESPNESNSSARIVEVSRPLPRDESLIANETTSLCRNDAERCFRVRLQVFDGERPSLILICTDGYSNAFESAAGFEQVGGDLLQALREQGVEAVSEGFADELENASRVGSGDDVTVAIIFRDAGPKPFPVIA